MASTDQKFIGLHAVFPEDGNFCALTASGAYTVDWGDGVIENFGTGVQANHLYDYTDADLAGTDAPVSFIAATSTINRTAHGFSNGKKVTFWNIVSTMGIVNGQVYYVVNATSNAFQVSATLNGAALTLTNDGSASLTRYKQAIVIVTPQSGQSLSSVNLNVKYSAISALPVYSTGWLDILVGSPNFSNLVIGLTSTTETIKKNAIERVRVLNLGSITSLAYRFSSLRALEVIELPSTSNVSNMSGMFLNCTSLQTTKLFDMSAVTLAADTSSGMFQGCIALKTIPNFNTQSLITISSTSGGMFSGCISLECIPLLNTSLVTSMGGTGAGLFGGCRTLKSVPLLDMSLNTSMNDMFNGCSNLQNIPLFNTASVSAFSNAFLNCVNLQAIPAINTQSVTSATNAFNGCASLQGIPELNLAAATGTTNIVNACLSLSGFKVNNLKVSTSIASCKLSTSALQEVFANLATVATSQTLTITSNYGVDTAVTKVVNTVAQSAVIPMAATAGLVIGQFVTGTGTGITTGVSVVSDVVADTLVLAAHGLTNGKRVSFSALGTTAGISLNTVYFVVNATASTFQVALTLGGSAIDLTGSNSTLTAKYPSYISSITANTSVTLDTPAATTAASSTLTFRVLDASPALMKNWAVTF
jgi:hypothetical protein